MRSLTVWLAVGLIAAGAVTGRAQNAQISIAMTPSATTMAVGGTLTYSITITNNVPGVLAQHVKVIDDLPVNLANPTIGSPPNTAGTTRDRDIGGQRRTSVECIAADLPVGQSFEVTITALVDSSGTCHSC